MNYKDIEGYEGAYSVCDDGRVWSVKSQKFLKQTKQNKGYLYVSLCKDGVPMKRTVHRLVASAFITGSGIVNHKDGNKENNNLSNLEVVNYSENNKHAYDTGLKKAAENTKAGKGNLNYKGEIVAINIETGESISMHGAKDIKSKGFRTQSVYACISGKLKTHKGHTFKRIK
jgi:hypothetical protein